MIHRSTLILKLIIGLIALLVLTVCVLTFPVVLSGEAHGYIPILIGVYVSTIPFFAGLFCAFKILNYIDKDQAFSVRTVQALKKIKQYAASISIFYTAGMPYIYLVADRDDAPGVIVIGLFFVLASFALATFAGVAQRLFQNAVDIQHENDLTV